MRIDSFLRQLDILSRFFILILILLVMALISPAAFWNYSNISTVVFQQAPFTILMSFGMTLAIITKGIDKSMGSILVLSNAVCASFFKNGQYLTGVAVALAIGITCGSINGVLITKVGIVPFIATYGVDFIALGLAYAVANGSYVYSFPDEFRQITNGMLIPGIPNIALITLVFFLILLFITKRTTTGRAIYSAGYSAKVAELSGINARRAIFIVYIINGLIAVLTGILYMARLNSADVNISGNFTLDSIASALIGGVSFGGGNGSVVNAVIGALIIVFIRNGMNILNISTNWQQAVIGFVIIFSIIYEMVVERIADAIKHKMLKNKKECTAA